MLQNNKRESLTNIGCIINISSLLGLKGGKGSVGYAASKAGVIGKLRPFLILYWYHRLTNLRFDQSSGIGGRQRRYSSECYRPGLHTFGHDCWYVYFIMRVFS